MKSLKKYIPAVSCLYVSLSIAIISCSQKADENLKYLGQTPPSLVPEIFAPGIISQKDESEFGSVFNSDATEFYYGVDINGKTEIRYSKLTGNTWSAPLVLLSHEKYGYNDPFLSPDEKRLYFISQRSLDGRYAKKDHDIWYIERNGNDSGWNSPIINAGPNINSGKNEYYISFTSDGTMYFSSNVNAPGERQYDFDIYFSKNDGGSFQKAISAGDSINTPGYEADVFVDPEESYIIFCANRQEGLGRGDLYISFKNPDGTWTKAKNMGRPINSEHHELCPFVSKDGKYLFYTSNQDIYWVDAGIIKKLRDQE